MLIGTADFYTPANIVWGVYRNRSFCLSVCPSVSPCN